MPNWTTLITDLCIALQHKASISRVLIRPTTSRLSASYGWRDQRWRSVQLAQARPARRQQARPAGQPICPASRPLSSAPVRPQHCTKDHRPLVVFCISNNTRWAQFRIFWIQARCLLSTHTTSAFPCTQRINHSSRETLPISAVRLWRHSPQGRMCGLLTRCRSS